MSNREGKWQRTGEVIGRGQEKCLGELPGGEGGLAGSESGLAEAVELLRSNREISP
jgi:hypothetical protein